MVTMPIEWVDKIFDYMESFFKEKWSANSNKIGLAKVQWQSGLSGLNKDEIKKGLSISKRMALNDQNPPNVLEFYHYSKGLRLPPLAPSKSEIPLNIELAKSSISIIRKQIRDHL